MIKVKYEPDVKYWFRLQDLRERIVAIRGRGGTLCLRGNLNEPCQKALLKAFEELPNCEITTSYRLCAAIESRGQVEGRCEVTIDPDLIGLFEQDQRSAEAVTRLRMLRRENDAEEEAQ